MSRSTESIATFASGCFWCTEAIFLRVSGVSSIQSGYMGGHVENPTYKAVCSGETGHAECIQITFDSERIAYEELLEIFWKTHDPTTLNRQGADVGSQYRSAVFYHSEDQKKMATLYRDRLNEEQVYPNPVVTEIVPAGIFYVAEDYHQNYFNLHSDAPYCSFVIQPKLDKFKKVFSNRLQK